MDLEAVKSKIVANVYHITADKKVALHKHPNHNELFFCMKGEGYGVLENGETKLTEGLVFNVPAGTMHALRAESNLYVSSFLIPVITDQP